MFLIFFKVNPKTTHTPSTTDTPTTATTITELFPYDTRKRSFTKTSDFYWCVFKALPSELTGIWLTADPRLFCAVQVTLWPHSPLNSDTVTLPLCCIVLLKSGESASLPSTVQEMTAFGLASAWHTHCRVLFSVEQNDPGKMDGASEWQWWDKG